MLLDELVSGMTCCCVCGKKEIDVTGIAWSRNAGPGEIAVLAEGAGFENSEAEVVLVPMGIYDTEKTVIISMNVELCAIELANRMIAAGLYRDYTRPVNYTMQPGYYRVGSNVVIGANTSIEAFTSIGDDVVIGDNCYIGTNVTIGSNVKIGNDVHIEDGSRIGSSPTCNYMDKGIRKSFGGIASVVIGDHVRFNCNCVVERGSFQDTRIGNNNVFSDAVCIGHDTVIHNDVYVMGQSCIASGVVIEDKVLICSQCGIKENIILGKGCVIKGRTGVIKDVPPDGCIFGNVGQNYRDEIRVQAALRQLIRR